MPSPGLDYRTSTGLGKQRLLEKLVPTGTQEKGAVTPQDTEPDLPVSVLESPAEVWVDSDLPWDQGHWRQQFWDAGMLTKVLLEEMIFTPTIEPSSEL